jgi:diaminopimelate epimerase
MSGSGNDFVVVDARSEPPGELERPEVVQAVCARGTGVGADGIVFLKPAPDATVELVYLNADGSLADLCGNATLCTTRLSVELGIGEPSGFTIRTGAGVFAARIGGDGRPEFDLGPVAELDPSPSAIARVAGERRIGFALAGVPHLVIEVDDLATVDVVGRGRPLRRHPSLAAGANVNFVSSTAEGWSMRTYERGVEGETLACGTGAVSTAALLIAWGLAESPVRLGTRSGRTLQVRFQGGASGAVASLSGEGRIVFQGTLSEI